MIMIPFSEHYSYNVETIYSIQVSYDTPTILKEKNLAYVESSKFSMLVDHEKNALGAGYIVEFIHDVLPLEHCIGSPRRGRDDAAK